MESIPTPGPLLLLLFLFTFLLPALGDSHLPPQKALLCPSHTGLLCPTSTPTGQESGQSSTIYQKAGEESEQLCWQEGNLGLCTALTLDFKPWTN